MANNVLPAILDVNVVQPLETSARGDVGIPVYLQDQTTDMLDLYFLQAKTSGLLLAVDTAIDSRSITLATGHGLTTANSAGHILEIADTLDARFYQGKILAITGDVVVLSPPMSKIFTVADSVAGTGNPNMVEDAATGVAIDGSVTPVIFTIQPLPQQSGDITRVIMATTSDNASDLQTFGGAPALTVGMTLRAKHQDGTFTNIFTYQDNFDIAIHGFDTGVFAPKLGNAVNGFIARVTFAGQSKHGVAVRLDGALNEELQIVILELMDNTPSGNISVTFIGEGSELQG